MSSSVVFMDTETTGLALTDELWEFAAVKRRPDGSEASLHLFIKHKPTLCRLLPQSFQDDHRARYDDDAAVTRADAGRLISAFLQGHPHIVGAVPNFDTERLALLLKRSHLIPSWHYHLIDVENLAVGWLAGRASRDRALMVPTPPWDSEYISNAVGVNPAQFERHTAMGDVLWARAIYDKVTGYPSAASTEER